MPSIDRGPDGSVDIFWDWGTNGKQLSVNVPEEGADRLAFFARNNMERDSPEYEEKVGVLAEDSDFALELLWLMK